MRLVHDDKRERERMQEGEKFRTLETLGGNIDQLAPSFAQQTHRGIVVLRGHRAVDTAGGNADAAQGGDLIVHQGDQRREDEGDAGEKQGGKLVAQGFSRTGGEYAESIPSGQNRIDERELSGTEAVISECLV